MSHPQVKWAQRRDKLFITVDVVDPRDVQVEFSAKGVTIRGEGVTKVGTARGPFSAALNLNGEIEPAKCTYKTGGSYVQICAVKSATGPHWERLLMEPTRATKAWLTCDWNLWKDEDEEDAREKIDFGGYGDLSNMVNAGSGANRSANVDSDDDDDDDIDTPPVNLKDLKLDECNS